MSVVMRGAHDVAPMAAIHADAFPDAAWSATSIGESLAAGARGYLAGAVADAPPSAMALARVAPDGAELLTLAVATAARRRGLGRALLRALIDDARSAGADELFLEVADDNAAARALYDAEGFRRVGARPFYYRRRFGGAADALILRLRLSEYGE